MLARAVQAAFGRAVVVVGQTALAGDASSRRYVQLRLRRGGPPTVVAMLVAGDRPALTSEELGGASATPRELPFANVGRYLKHCGLPVPAIYLDASARDGLVLVEDVGDTTLWAASEAAPEMAVALFKQAVDLLVEMQVAGSRQPDPSCEAFKHRFDGSLSMAEVEHFVEHGIETRQGHAMPELERRELLLLLQLVCAPFGRELGVPEVLVHRDFMAWNLHVQNNRLRLIDFQDALLGPDTYDLAALLTDRTTSRLITPPREELLIQHFITKRAEVGLGVTGDVFQRYRQCALHRALKVIGRFYFLERVKGKSGYLAYLPCVYDVARRMFAHLPMLAPAQAIIARYVPELAPGTKA